MVPTPGALVASTSYSGAADATCGTVVLVNVTGGGGSGAGTSTIGFGGGGGASFLVNFTLPQGGTFQVTPAAACTGCGAASAAGGGGASAVFITSISPYAGVAVAGGGGGSTSMSLGGNAGGPGETASAGGLSGTSTAVSGGAARRLRAGLPAPPTGRFVPRAPAAGAAFTPPRVMVGLVPCPFLAPQPRLVGWGGQTAATVAAGWVPAGVGAADGAGVGVAALPPPVLALPGAAGPRTSTPRT